MRHNAELRTTAAEVTRFGNVSVSRLRIGRTPGRVGASLPEPRRDASQLVFVLDGDLEAGAADVLVMTLSGTASAAREIVRTPVSGVGNVLLTCLRSALQVEAELGPQARAELGQALDDLGRLALRERARPGRRPSGRSVMRERVKAFVRHHLHDSSLSIDDIAQTFNCTKRYLHKVFSEDECSLNQYIWELRLERCSQDLANAELRKRSITEIALVWGFRSPPHFSRAFRQRFGASPSAYRSRQVAAGRAGSLPRLPAGPSFPSIS